jgi:hypothetical protein
VSNEADEAKRQELLRRYQELHERAVALEKQMNKRSRPKMGRVALALAVFIGLPVGGWFLLGGWGIAVGIVGFFVFLVVAVKVHEANARRFMPKLPVPARGASVGRITIHHHLADKKVGIESSLPEAEIARAIVFYADDMLFYYGNGSRAHDRSGPLREAIQSVLDGAAPEWTFDAKTTSDGGGGKIGCELFAGGISGERVIGWTNQDACRKGGVPALVSMAIAGSEGPRAKKALAQMLAWHAEHGPMPTMGNAARAHAAWHGIQPG